MIEVALIEAAKQSARVDLLRALILQGNFNSIALEALSKLALGGVDITDTLVELAAANKELSTRIDTWLEEAEKAMQARNG